MNPWIIIGIIVYLGLGFVARCALKYSIVERYQVEYGVPGIFKARKEAWGPIEEILVGVFVLSGVGCALGLIAAVATRQ